MFTLFSKACSCIRLMYKTFDDTYLCLCPYDTHGYSIDRHLSIAMFFDWAKSTIFLSVYFGNLIRCQGDNDLLACGSAFYHASAVGRPRRMSIKIKPDRGNSIHATLEIFYVHLLMAYRR